MFSVSAAKKQRRKKPATPVVDNAFKRVTRSSKKNDGYRPTPVIDGQIRAKKRACRKPNLSKGQTTSEAEGSKNAQDREEIPETPISIMQHVGIQLGIDPAKLTKEKLEAAPELDKSSEASDD